MTPWQIVALIGLALILFFIFVKHNKRLATATTAVAVNNTIGGQLARNVPVVGTVLKVAGAVEKPIQGALHSVNSGVSSVLKHVPIIGGVAARINTGVGNAVDSVLNQLFRL
jgi:hypothetical protein